MKTKNLLKTGLIMAASFLPLKNIQAQDTGKKSPVKFSYGPSTLSLHQEYNIQNEGNEMQSNAWITWRPNVVKISFSDRFHAKAEGIILQPASKDKESKGKIAITKLNVNLDVGRNVKHGLGTATFTAGLDIFNPEQAFEKFPTSNTTLDNLNLTQRHLETHLGAKVELKNSSKHVGYHLSFAVHGNTFTLPSQEIPGFRHGTADHLPFSYNEDATILTTGKMALIGKVDDKLEINIWSGFTAQAGIPHGIATGTMATTQITDNISAQAGAEYTEYDTPSSSSFVKVKVKKMALGAVRNTEKGENSRNESILFLEAQINDKNTLSIYGAESNNGNSKEKIISGGISFQRKIK